MSGHRHGWPYDGETPEQIVTPGLARSDYAEKCFVIGEHHCVRPTDYTDGRLAGFIIAHDVADMDVRCEGFLTVARPANPSPAEATRSTWSMTGSLLAGDLTLSPSVLCKRDGDHGFVREGKWVSA